MIDLKMTLYILRPDLPTELNRKTYDFFLGKQCVMPPLQPAPALSRPAFEVMPDKCAVRLQKSLSHTPP